ncbi:subunit V of photosystem I reaction center [Chloropicon primus]|uniref:PSI-G n=1 Tax=Chloropicon primus TaxID=1764295 RepID=A0A5B8ML63_9CHLO|nr:subunit V of photosystem I reaction center [Chloropicon primus]UPQ99352.1 subunit V of photosystem I reaction center [Chloropicon primus]|eukprot:QDZ20140.1 subunit V of photosystem I reaction center [Chloropicon primus]
MKGLSVRPGVGGGRRGGVVARVSTAGTSSRRVTKMGDTQVIMSVANGALLALGRWGFLPYQRRQVEKAGLPTQADTVDPSNPQTHFEAGDDRAQEAEVFFTKDPAGFTIIDVLAWGSLGHVIGFACLAAKNANDLGVTVSPHW